ncbi:septal ring lytic transglycosylase RlpA family protein [Methyloradius palustris]|uniref:Endolytic peptidoglycan transglycosylase RlpA n=1 Tax=Methyloradius palustris TaxID=2778876 RepID=A0A8D5GG40_9PROT|nr:septal ring lytic transglycosylase RlpA family protein [Methyloradius palustris]BCM26109.1 lipoprotein [Methyloradius palustris]
MTYARIVLITLCTLILTACGGASSVKPNTTTPTATSANKPAVAATPSKKGGGYYLDDGPGDNPPADIDSIPDAIPRLETPLPRANRPYVALGTRYTPYTAYVPYKAKGIASWYGKRYHGQKTSSGEIYDMYGMTGAHTILPLPSYVKVTNPENGKSVIVRINDRGPFHSDRLIDLSYAAAYKLRLVGKGSGLVEVESIDASKYPNQYIYKAEAATVAAPPIQAVEVPATPAPVSTQATASPANVEPAQSAVAANPTTITEITSPGDYVQVGAFKIETNAEGLKSKLAQNKLVENVSIHSWYNNGTYRVLLGPYTSRQDAEDAASDIKKVLGSNAIVIRR